MTDEEIARAVSNLSEKNAYGRIDRSEVIDICKRVRDEIKAKMMADIAGKDAKIYAYETIIANSNFKAVVVRKKREEAQNETI